MRRLETVIGIFSDLSCAPLGELADVSGEPICLRFRGQDVIHKLSQSVADIRTYTTQQPRRTKISTTLRRKPGMSLNGDRYVLFLETPVNCRTLDFVLIITAHVF